MFNYLHLIPYVGIVLIVIVCESLGATTKIKEYFPFLFDFGVGVRSVISLTSRKLLFGFESNGRTAFMVDNVSIIERLEEVCVWLLVESVNSFA